MYLLFTVFTSCSYKSSRRSNIAILCLWSCPNLFVNSVFRFSNVSPRPEAFLVLFLSFLLFFWQVWSELLFSSILFWFVWGFFYLYLFLLLCCQKYPGCMQALYWPLFHRVEIFSLCTWPSAASWISHFFPTLVSVIIFINDLKWWNIKFQGRVFFFSNLTPKGHIVFCLYNFNIISCLI